MRPNDPRIRQRINQLSHNFESANETAQEGIYAFSHYYLSPCFGAIGNCISACTASCLPNRADQLRRRRRGRAEANFDFYDDWDNDVADDGMLGWGTGELDHLLAGSGLGRGSSEQPRRQRQMSYGTRDIRRKSSALGSDDRNDPTVIPRSSFLGFLERFPWRFGARGQKYQPSVADLQEHPKGLRHHAREDELLLEGNEEDEGYQGSASLGGNGRDRSGTQSSRETNTSLSSRGDLIPSDEEEDAVPLDDELAMALARRGTGFDSEDVVLERKGSVKRSTSGTLSPGTVSSKGSKRRNKRKNTAKSARISDTNAVQKIDTPSLTSDLREEEAEAEREEESEIAQKRLAARKLAANRGSQQESGMQVPSSPLSRDLTIPAEELPNHGLSAVGSRHSTFQRETSEDHARPSALSSKWDLSRQQSGTEPFPPLPPIEVPDKKNDRADQAARGKGEKSFTDQSEHGTTTQ